MMTIDEMNAIRRQCGLTYQTIAEKSGMPISTVQKILGGITQHPRVDTMKQLQTAIEQLQNSSGYSYLSAEETRAGAQIPSAHEPGAVYGVDSIDGTAARKLQSPYTTIEERDEFPPERRTELIHGIVYDMSSPTPNHQRVAMGLYDQIRDCMNTHPDTGCELFIAPVDVVLDRPDNTVVVPDIFIVCDESIVGPKKVESAPDFVAEVLSPSTANRDKFIKLEEYARTGVREYWIADQYREKVYVYLFHWDDETENNFDNDPDSTSGDVSGKESRKSRKYRLPDYDVNTYTFEDVIPVAISEGKCSIDMKLIKKRLR